MGFAEPISKLLDTFEQERHYQKEKQDEALDALTTAVNKTKIYIRQMERRKGRDRDFKAEEEISQLWAHAATPISHFDADLAERCQYKASYWTHPEGWLLEAIKARNIEISQIDRELRALRKRLREQLPESTRNPSADDGTRRHLEQLRQACVERLRVLELQAATLGAFVPAHIVTDTEQCRQQIADIERQLGSYDTTKA